MYQIIISSNPNIHIYNDKTNSINNRFDTYEDANHWVSKNFKNKKYIMIDIIETFEKVSQNI